jgi:membrane fusion protein, multidrug efflux system
MTAIPAATAKRRRRGLRLLSVGGLAAIVLAGGLLTAPRLWTPSAPPSTDESAKSPLPVSVALARETPPDAERTLPGNALPLAEAAIYARTNGYIKSRLADIGDHVKEGQLLAEIATPEIDAQLEQSRATLLQNRANLDRDKAKEAFARSEVKRYRDLVQNQGVSKQDYESAVASLGVASATVKATESTLKVNEADIQRLVALQSFEKLTAPFAGVVTVRNVDPGDLVSADTPNGGREMFHVMRTDVLRVFVSVPQTFSTSLRVGQDAVVYRREDPTRTFPGKVARTANALDPNTRTLLTEVDVPNPRESLRPGMYLQVKFLFKRDVPTAMIPAAAVVTRTGGPMVGVLDDQKAVRYQPVELGRDYGAEIQVVSGLKPGDSVVIRPGDDLPEGTVVRPLPLPAR